MNYYFYDKVREMEDLLGVEEEKEFRKEVEELRCKECQALKQENYVIYDALQQAHDFIKDHYSTIALTDNPEHMIKFLSEILENHKR